jgi:hypothetical protein
MKTLRERKKPATMTKRDLTTYIKSRHYSTERRIEKQQNLPLAVTLSVIVFMRERHAVPQRAAGYLAVRLEVGGAAGGVGISPAKARL